MTLLLFTVHFKSQSVPLVEQAPISSVKSKAERYIFAPITAIPNELFETAFGFFGQIEEVESPCKAYLYQ